MVEQERFRLTEEGPTVYNEDSPENRFTTTTSKIESPTGEEVVDVTLYHEEGYYGVRWSNVSGSITPNKFFSRAQETVSSIREKGQIEPLKYKTFEGLDYALKDGELVEVDMDDFGSIKDLDRDNLAFARFSTPYGDFVYESRVSDVGETIFKLTVLTHIHAPDELSQLVLDSSLEEIPHDMLRGVLDRVGSQASQRMSEKIAAKQKASLSS